jgi:glycosyltransferase involved in cell wall biosynthesis
MTPPIRWIVSQIGARQHYGIPRGFEHAGRLRQLYTDLWWPSRRFSPRRPAALARLAARQSPDIPSARVVAFPIGSLAQRYLNPIRPDAGESADYLRYLEEGAWFGRRVAQHLATLDLDPALDAFFAFNTGCLETLQWLKRHHPTLITIVDQIDPGPLEEELVLEECRAWPLWHTQQRRIPQRYWDRLRAEWDCASLVLVNSQWSGQALIRVGVAEEKLIVVPVAHEVAVAHEAPGIEKASSAPVAGLSPARPARQRTDQLRVLWLGSVNLRKGIPYLVEAARLLLTENIRIDVHGPLQVASAALAQAPANLTFHGPVPRIRAAEIYAQSDVFVLPTISDGFAITQVEAMAMGLPVIATPNCGAVVTHDVDGLIVPPRDARALADAIALLAHDRDRLTRFSTAAIAKAKTFSLDSQTQLIEAATLTCRQAAASPPQAASAGG